MAQQDDYFYEIQLTNKQLVFYFLAGATGLILAFLAGVMVGRGVDQGTGDVQAARPPGEERVIAEETPRPAPPAQELSYAQRLESERTDDRLERVKPATPAPATAPPATAAAAPRPAATPRATPPPVRRAEAVPPATRPAQPARPAPATAGGGTFSIQVGAFKDRGSADTVVARLKSKGFAAYVVSPQDGLFNVRVGNYTARPDAESVQEKLREQKFSPFIVKN